MATLLVSRVFRPRLLWTSMAFAIAFEIYMGGDFFPVHRIHIEVHVMRLNVFQVGGGKAIIIPSCTCLTSKAR